MYASGKNDDLWGGHWNGPRCPELVAGLRKQVKVLVMATDVHGNLPTMGHVTGRAAHPVTYMYPPPNGNILVASQKEKRMKDKGKKRTKQCKKRVAQKNM